MANDEERVSKIEHQHDVVGTLVKLRQTIDSQRYAQDRIPKRHTRRRAGPQMWKNTLQESYESIENEMRLLHAVS